MFHQQFIDLDSLNSLVIKPSVLSLVILMILYQNIWPWRLLCRLEDHTRIHRHSFSCWNSWCCSNSWFSRSKRLRILTIQWWVKNMQILLPLFNHYWLPLRPTEAIVFSYDFSLTWIRITLDFYSSRWWPRLINSRKIMIKCLFKHNLAVWRVQYWLLYRLILINFSYCFNLCLPVSLVYILIFLDSHFKFDHRFLLSS